MTDTTTAPTAAPAVRFPRMPRRGLLMGLSTLRVATLAVGVLALTIGLFAAGSIGAALSSPVWVTSAVVTFVRWNGRPAIEWAPTLGHFAWRRATGQTSYRARPERPRPAGTLALPGDAASLRFLIDEASGTAMLHDPHAHTLTAIGLVHHRSFVLLAPGEQAARVQGWSRTLAHLAATGTDTRVQVLEISLPDSGHGILGWWQEHCTAKPGTWVVRQWEDLVRQVVPAAATHRTLVAVSLDLRTARSQIRSSGRGIRAAAAFLRQELASFEAGLRSADLFLTKWLGQSDLAALMRTAYEPGYEQREQHTLDLADAGPLAVEEHWDHIRHDTGHSAVLWINEWPRVPAPPFFLHALIFQPGIRKTLSLTCEPVPAQEALRDIRRARVEYATDSVQKAKLGVLADLSDSVEAADVLDRERALIEGHADIRFTGLVTITAPTHEELEAAIAETARAAIQCGCETRRLYGQQARAFTAAALPLARRVSR